LYEYNVFFQKISRYKYDISRYKYDISILKNEYNVKNENENDAEVDDDSVIAAALQDQLRHDDESDDT